MITVGQRIRAIRLSANMTQEELASYVGTTKQNIWKYESGVVTNIPMERIVAIANALHVPASELLGWSPPASKPMSSFREDELRLVSYYRQLNRQGQELVMQTAVTAVRSELYLPGDSTADPLTADIG